MSDKDLIVTILVPTRADDLADNGPMHGAIGTGCVVGADLILTSRHVLAVGDRRNRDFPIRVRWYALRENDPEDNGGWRDLDPDQHAIVWPEDDGLDAALLRCPSPQDAELAKLAPYRIATTRPRDGLEWAGRGFPRSHRAKGRLHGDFIGKVMSSGRSDSVFSVTSTLKIGKRQRDWSGASGMPVIVDGSVLGVIKSVPDRYDNSELEAVPASLIRADPVLAGALGFDPLPDLIACARGLICDALRQSPAAADRLAKFLVPACSHAEQCLDELAQVALDTPVDRLVEHALKAQAQLRREGLAADADDVADFIQAVLPTRADTGQVDHLCRDAAGPGAILVRLDAHSPTMAEILMSAADRRPTSFRVLHRPNANPVGEALIGRLFSGGETGRDANGAQCERDLLAGLLTLFESSVDESLDQAFFDHLKYALTPPEYHREPYDSDEAEDWRKELANDIDDALRGLAIDRMPYADRFTYYVVAELPSGLSDTQRARIDGILERVNARFKQIAVVCIGPGGHRALRELRPFGNLRQLLYREPPREAP